MKPVLQYGIAALLCGLLGYGLGQPVKPSALPHAPTLISSPGGPLAKPPAAWKLQLTFVREAPASRSRAAWAKWAFSVPDADLPAAISSLNPKLDFAALQILFTRWVRLDPTVAWKEFHATPLPLYSVLGGMNPFSASLSGPRDSAAIRYAIASAMLEAWSNQDPAAAREYASELKRTKFVGSNHPSDALDFKIEALLRAGPTPRTPEAWAAALEATTATTDPYDKEKVLASWAGRDPDAACRWLVSQPGAPGFGVVSLLRQSDPALQSELLARYVRGSWIPYEEIPRALRSLSGSFYRELQLDQFITALGQWTAADQPAALAWLEAQPADRIKSFLTGQIAGAISQTSPRDALTLLEKLPEPELPIALTGLINGWMKQDAAACAAWVARIEDPVHHDTCQLTMARAILNSDPVMALRFSAQITSEKPRRQIQERIVSRLGGTASATQKIIGGDPHIKASLPPVSPSGHYDFGLSEDEYLDF